MTNNARPRHAAPTRTARMAGRAALGILGAPIAMLAVAGPSAAAELELGGSFTGSDADGRSNLQLESPDVPEAEGLDPEGLDPEGFDPEGLDADALPGAEDLDTEGLQGLDADAPDVQGIDRGLPDLDRSGLPEADLPNAGDQGIDGIGDPTAGDRTAVHLDLDGDRATASVDGGLPSDFDAFSVSDLTAGLV